MLSHEDVEPRQVSVRSVGVCSHCGGRVLLRIRAYRFLSVREASCPCGATVIAPSFFKGLGQMFTTAVRR